MISILLPGLDGTADLFGPFLAEAPAEMRLQAMRLPAQGPQTYPELANWVLPRLPPEPLLLIAESFSGPLAVLLAARSANVVGVVLCSTFVEPPLPGFLAALSAPFFFAPPPLLALQLMLTGGDRELAKAVQRATASVRREVLVGRIHSALHVDVTEAFAGLSQPLLYLRARRDRVVPAASGDRILALQPSTRLVEVDAPHLLLQTEPAEAWRSISEFLNARLAGS